tara:strand:+ start:2427 stop:3203 length:777 start_codon:yes stop_codon:yes gene_type:complete
VAIIKKFRIKSFKQKKTILSLKNISLSFQNRQILENISFEINQGEIFGMLGPNGVGKSTIFNLVTGLIKPDKGDIFIKDEKVNNYPIFMRTSKFKIGYVPQYGGYFYDLTLYENLKAVAEILLKDQRKRAEKINYLISKFDLSQIRDIKAKFLSGGQKKKLVIAMALLGEPELLLLDECFAALDVMTIKMLQQIIVNLQFENQITICICDHQARDLLTCVDVAMVLSEGKVVAKGTPTELVQNENARTAYFGDSFKFN